MYFSRRSLIQNSAATIAAGVLPLTAHAGSAHTSGLIFGAGPDGRCDDAKVGGPYVVWSAEENLWRMYYYGRSKRFPEDVAPGFGTGSIALATSKDGISWQRFDGPLEEGAIFTASSDESAFDAMHVGLGNVIHHNGEWVMSYFGGDATIPTEVGGHPTVEGFHFKGYRCRPGIARSKDGINWTRVPGNGPGGATVDIGDNIYGLFPTLFFNGDEYLLYYTVLSPKYAFWDCKIASSTDLVNWTDRGSLNWARGFQAWETGGFVTCRIMKNPIRRGKKWMMVYTARDANFGPYIRRIGIAESDDAIEWTQKYKDPIFFPAETRQWDSGGVAYGQIVEIGDNFHLYYYGFAHRNNSASPQRGIGLAVSDGKDLTSFRRINR